VGLFQYPIARWAGRRHPGAVLAAGALLQGLALLILLPFSPLPWLVVSVLVLVAGEMLVSPLESALAARIAPAHLRGSYQGVLDFAFAISFGPAAFAGIALAGSGHGEVFLAYALPLSIAAALCFVALTRGQRGSTGLAPA
jgi:predicted MFS family arabinose efflux permease